MPESGDVSAAARLDHIFVAAVVGNGGSYGVQGNVVVGGDTAKIAGDCLRVADQGPDRYAVGARARQPAPGALDSARRTP